MILTVGDTQQLGSWIPQLLWVYCQNVLFEENIKLTTLPSGLAYSKILSSKMK